MIKSDQDKIKEEILKYRRQGADKKSCATLGGIGRKTLYKWLEDDSTFDTHFKKAWKEYMMGLVKVTKQKDPKYLLANDFSYRFKDVTKQPQQLNVQGDLIVQIANMSDDQIKQRLGELRGNALTGGTESPPVEG